MRLFRPVAVALGGLLFAVTLPTVAASAESAPFIWEGPNGKLYSVTNPPGGKCLSMAQQARAPRNNTKMPAIVYSKRQCAGTKYRLAPGQQAPRNVVFASMVFNPR
ncbi:hypothetical protein FCH28_29495 [Streptomyces piniterrae]|uniref:Uncharacterized protein n=1 Tax=Streptomyces piniterrae TaxID=2571125 RepID=A0A4U0MV90_9ACTN|nr:hypothetical protein FCH28_29495 [Streptomyces piniterrae]